MKVSIQEYAALCKRNPMTIRARVKKGHIKTTLQKGVQVIDTAKYPPVSLMTLGRIPHGKK